MTLKCLLCLSNYFLMPVSNMIPNKSKHSKLKVILSEARQGSAVPSQQVRKTQAQHDKAKTWWDNMIQRLIIIRQAKFPLMCIWAWLCTCELQNKMFKLMEAHNIFAHVLLKLWLGMCKTTKTSAKCDVICICSSSALKGSSYRYTFVIMLKIVISNMIENHVSRCLKN